MLGALSLDSESLGLYLGNEDCWRLVKDRSKLVSHWTPGLLWDTHRPGPASIRVRSIVGANEEKKHRRTRAEEMPPCT